MLCARILFAQRAQGICKCVMYVDDGICLQEKNVWARVLRRCCTCGKFVDDGFCLLERGVWARVIRRCSWKPVKSSRNVSEIRSSFSRSRGAGPLQCWRGAERLRGKSTSRARAKFPTLEGPATTTTESGIVKAF